MTRFSSKLGVFLVMGLGLSTWAHSHALLHELKPSGQAITLHLFYEGGREKPWFEQYQIFSPDDTFSFQEGRINELGEVSFRPNQTGNWRIDVVTSDGHARSVTVPVTLEDSTTNITQAQTARSSLERLITVVGYALGIFGLIMLWRQRRAWRSGAS